MDKELSRECSKAPGYHLGILHRLSLAYLSPRMRSLGLSRGWIALLMETLEQPGQTQDALRRSIKVDRAAAARTLFELERRGYIVRREDARDRRQKLVYPTSKTLALATGLFEVLDKHNEALFKGFDHARREEALSILRAMAANLEEAINQDNA